MVSFHARPKFPRSSLRFARNCRGRPLALFIPYCFVLPLINAPMLPIEDCPEDHHHQIDPKDYQPLPPRDVYVPFALLPVFADVEEFLRIVCDDTVESFTYRPPHHGLVVHRPREDGSALCSRISDESRTKEGSDD